MKDFDTFEQLFVELIGEFQGLTGRSNGINKIVDLMPVRGLNTKSNKKYDLSESRLREAVRNEATRAECSEAAREAAERAAAEARSSAAAAAAGATHAATTLAATQEELTALKMQLDLLERQRTLLEERCVGMLGQVSSLEREVQQLRPLQATHGSLQRQYQELQERIQLATKDARNESSRLESELRRVERCASGGTEIRERARLAAAAHARERRLAAAELQHTTRELQQANSEIARLGALVIELQLRISSQTIDCKAKVDDSESMAELRAALEAERAGSARLERALAAAVADNATLAASLHVNDNISAVQSQSKEDPVSTNICPIDSFLAE